jgi:membrane fusion protein
MPDTQTSSAVPSTGGANIRLLFRHQAVEHQRQSPYGTVLLLRPFSYKMLTLAVAVLGALLVAFFVSFGTVRKAHVQGVVLPDSGVLRIQANQTGRLVNALVREGQSVKRGELLFVLNSERGGASVESAEGLLAQLLQQQRTSYAQELRQSSAQAAQKALALARRETDLEAEVAQLSHQVVMQQQRVQIAEQSFRRYEELLETSYISAASLQEKQGELLDQRQRLADLQRNVLVKKGELSRLASERQVGDLQGQREAEALRRSASSVDQELTENQARSQVMVRAPIDGIVTAIGTTPGQVVTTATVLASLLPNGAQLEAEVYAPSRAIGFIKPGMQVLVRYQAYPHQKFGQHPAQVKEISHTSMPRADLPLGLAGVFKDDEPHYKIRLGLERQYITAYGQQVPLKSGMLLDASVQLEERALYEWIVEPLLSISGRL